MRVVYVCVLATFGCCLCLPLPDHGCKETTDGDKTTKPCINRGSGTIEKQSEIRSVGPLTVDQYSDMSVVELVSLLKSLQADPVTTQGTVGYYHQTGGNLLTTRRKRSRSRSRRFPVFRPARRQPKGPRKIKPRKIKPRRRG